MYSVTKCNLCQGSEFRIKHTIKKNPHFKYLLSGEEKIGWKELKIVHCKNCGLVFTNPRFSFEEVSKIYTNEYHEAHGEQSKLEIYNERLDHIREWKKSGNLLDIGCGYGYFLKVASKYFDVAGLELSPSAVEFIKKNQRIPVISDDFLRAEFNEQSFDVITLWDVIEHLYDPYSNLIKINRILKKGGILTLRTGDISSLNAQISGKKWFFYHLIHHVYFFSRETLTEMLNKSGFEVLDIYREERSLKQFMRWIRNILASLKNYILATFYNKSQIKFLYTYLKTKPQPVSWALSDQMVIISRKIKDI